uniref:Choline transporter-like protein n=1 Tax=Sparus aurata TaxID=8175 RepID=A0A671W4X1_SPAAU
MMSYSFLFPGEPAEFDPGFNGPIKKRGCTDIICCILFMAVIIGYAAVGILAWLYGDPRHVLYPRNSTGWFCGTGPNKDRPNLFYFDFLKCATSVNVMATALNGFQCPTTQLVFALRVEKGNRLHLILIIILIGSRQLDINTFKLLSLFVCCINILAFVCVFTVFVELCPFASYCLKGEITRPVPAFVLISDVVNGFNAREIGVRIFEDFASSWPWILIGLLIAMVVSMLFLLLLRFTAPVMVWVLIIGLLGAGAYGKHSPGVVFKANCIIGLGQECSVYLQVQETWLAFCESDYNWFDITSSCVCSDPLRAISHMMSALLYPLVTFVLLLVCVAYWGATALQSLSQSLYTLNHSSSSQNFTSSAYPDCPSASCIFIKYNDEGLLQRNIFNLQIYNAVAFLWCVNFVIALGQCTLAGAFASYYWAFSKPGDIPMFPLSASFIRSLRYHVGSLAFGSLILTLVQVVRIILEYIDHKTRSAQNPCARFLMCCLKCCFWCLEKFIKFLNRNAYIMIAIYGKNFCVSAKNAFMLLMRNIVRVVVLDKVTDLLLFFGKLLVVGGVGVLSFFFFSGRILLPGNTFRSETLNYYWMPIITVIFGSYLIAHGFFSVYNMCVDTLFLCFLEDLERHDGSLQKPYYMSKNLMKILNKSNKAAKTDRKKK